MKWMIWVGLMISSLAFAEEPVTLSGPVPALEQHYGVGTSQTVVYTVTNKVPKKLPVTVSGISGPITRTPVSNDCGNSLPIGPASCNIGIQIAPTIPETSVNQTLKINYDGRGPLTSQISFSALQPLAYVTPGPNASEVLGFLLDTTNGLFTTVNTAYSSVTQYFDQLTFAIVGGVQYAYVLDQNGYVYQCTINTDDTFGTCTATPTNPPSWAPHAIAFATVNGTQYAYVGEVNNEYVYQCSLNPDGSFNSCAPVSGSPTFNAPYGISFATIAGVQYAYIADAGPGNGVPGTVYRCSLNSDGSFNSCPSQLNLSWFPYVVSFATSGGTQYAYVADNGSGSSPAGNVFRCILNNDGTFNSCAPTPTVGAPTVNWFPADLAFATLDGTQYAYVANYQGPTAGGMNRCLLNNDGTFTNSSCTPTPVSPPSPWQPVGVAFRFK